MFIRHTEIKGNILDLLDSINALYKKRIVLNIDSNKSVF